MSDSPTRFQPVDSGKTPRFAGPITFMRLPQVADPAGLDIALVGVPWDGGTTNRPGARHGPREVRAMSTFMRRVHHVSRIAPYQICNVADLGDAPVNPFDIQDTITQVEAFFGTLHGAGAVPLAAGGDHLATLPIMRAIAAPSRPLGMVHFDAHSDTTDRYFGDNRYTHGTPFRRAIEEGILDPGRTIQIGIRGSIYGAEDFAFAEEHGVRMVFIEEYFEKGPDAVMAEARAVVGDGPTYVSFDIDAIDPAFAPGTGTPEVGGYSAFEAQRMVRALQGLDLVGADLVEVAPPFDPSGNTALLGATIMFELLCVLADAVARRRG